MKIEKLTQSQKQPQRWYAVLENGESLRLNLDIIAAFGLFTGRELTDEEYSELSQRCRETGVRERALRILGARMLSRKELVRRLTEKGEDEQAAIDAADWLESMGYLDDEAYAAAIVRHYSARGYGENRLRDELHRRGIPRELWDEAMLHMPQDSSALDALVEKELAKIPQDEALRRAAIGRLEAKLIRRGFPRSDVWEAISRHREQ